MKVLAAGLALVLLAACGSEKAGPNPVLSAVGSFAKDSLAKVSPGKKDAKGGEAKGGKGAKPADRRAELEKAGKPVLRLSSKAMGLSSFVRVADAKGPVLTWATPDGATFSQRNGVLIQTRGLGADLMSAKAPSVAQLMQPGQRYKRIYYFLGDDDQGVKRTYDCVTKIAGPDRVEILGRTHATTHVVETCTRSGVKLKNDFWIEGSKIRQSREWVSAGIGHIEFARVVD